MQKMQGLFVFFLLFLIVSVRVDLELVRVHSALNTFKIINLKLSIHDHVKSIERKTLSSPLFD